ncbi:MAG: phosphoribosylglycinamide formyltransferase [Bacillota bacterium]|jgi:phosphoribosylglycinamide formyltransferase-1|nr:phosphoribosylglycinamide formyltransferase [Bacillota bacterium]
MPRNIGVLASGRGTNLQAIIDGASSGGFDGRVAVVVSDRSKAPALDRARQAGIPAVFVSKKEAGSQEAFERSIAGVLDAHGVDVVCLAGFMRILGPWFVRWYWGRMLNIHPALLPSFPGLEAQRQALEYGVKVSGCTVHFADEGVDAGPIIIQRPVLVRSDDTFETLSERILVEEHKAYVEALRLLCDGRLEIQGKRVIVTGSS